MMRIGFEGRELTGVDYYIVGITTHDFYPIADGQAWDWTTNQREESVLTIPTGIPDPDSFVWVLVDQIMAVLTVDYPPPGANPPPAPPIPEPSVSVSRRGESAAGIARSS